MLLQAQQVAVGGIDAGPNQHGPPALKNLVVGALIPASDGRVDTSQ
jgi:hypothetical protein